MSQLYSRYKFGCNYMSEYFFRKVAESFLMEERAVLYGASTPTMPITVNWRGIPYPGFLQPCPLRPEIVYVVKSPQMTQGFMDALRELDAGRPDLVADDSLELDRREFFLRRTGDRLEGLRVDDVVYLTELLGREAFDKINNS